MATLCEIEACGQPVAGHGLCGKHYIRWQKHGDPLKVLRVRGEPQVDLVCSSCEKTFKRMAAYVRKHKKMGTALPNESVLTLLAGQPGVLPNE